MATIGANNLTLTDWTKRIDPDGNVPVIGELLSQTNEIVTDMVWREGNLPTGERVIIRTGLPDVYFRSLNQGIPNSKSQTAQVDEGCAIIEARSEVDKDLAMLNGNTSQFRLSEDTAFLESMNQTMADTLFNGDPATDPKRFLGLRYRYNTPTGAGNSGNVLRAQLQANVTASKSTSIYLVCWGDQTVYGIFPKGSKAGLVHEDLGEQTVYNGDLRMQALSTRYQWKCGLVVKDWRCVVRICNVDTVDLVDLADASSITSYKNIIHQMAQAYYLLPSSSAGRCAFYMNRTVHAAMSRIAMEKSLGVMNIEQGLTQFGKPHSFLSFLGVPLRKCDAILNTEAAI
jgi:hypothetical protein